MKTNKFLFILLAFFLLSPLINCQTSVNQLFNKYSKEKGVDRVNLGKLTMSFVGIFEDVMGVKGVEVLSFGACEQSVKEKLSKAISSLKDESYETLVSVNEETERTKILIKLKDESIHELIVLTTGNDPAMIRIKGNIKPSDIERITKR